MIQLATHAVPLCSADAASSDPQYPPMPKWVQVAQAGNYRGYGNGRRPFVFDRSVFASLVANIHRHPAFIVGEDGFGCAPVIPWDFGHASEMSPCEGALPCDGAPAQGWTFDLQIREGASGPELWSLTLFLEPARTYVLEHKYRWASVAVSFSSVDPLTGEDMGPTMSSVALTNTPFIAGMAELAASALESKNEPDAVVAPAESVKGDNEMDALKIACALGLGDNSGEDEILAAASSAIQNAARLAELREKHSNLLLALGCENEDAAISRYIDLSMAAAEWEKAKPVLDEMRLAEEARANEAVIRDVDAAMKAHSLPESVRDALILQRRSNADAFAAKFPVLSPASANLAQPAPSAPVQASAAQQARRDLASAVDVSSYSGATLHLRAQAYVAATMPGIAGNYETVHKLARAMVRDGRVR